MAHAVIWKYTDPQSETMVLIGHPGTYSTDSDTAIAEARKTMATLEGFAIVPLAVVETDEDIHDDVYDREEVYLGPDEDLEELFFNISGMGKWASQPWWPAEYR